MSLENAPFLVASGNLTVKTRKLQHYLLHFRNAQKSRGSIKPCIPQNSLKKKTKKEYIYIYTYVAILACILAILCARSFAASRREGPTSSTLWIFAPYAFPSLFFRGRPEYAPISAAAAGSRERVGVVIFCASGFQRARARAPLTRYTTLEFRNKYVPGIK